MVGMTRVSAAQNATCRLADLLDDLGADRLDIEFNAPSEVLPAPYEAIRYTDDASAARLREVGGIRILRRGDGRLVALFESRYRLQRLENDEPDLMLETIAVD